MDDRGCGLVALSIALSMLMAVLLVGAVIVVFLSWAYGNPPFVR